MMMIIFSSKDNDQNAVAQSRPYDALALGHLQSSALLCTMQVFQ